jgi:hypothetical protein
MDSRKLDRAIKDYKTNVENGYPQKPITEMSHLSVHLNHIAEFFKLLPMFFFKYQEKRMVHFVECEKLLISCLMRVGDAIQALNTFKDAPNVLEKDKIIARMIVDEFTRMEKVGVVLMALTRDLL